MSRKPTLLKIRHQILLVMATLFSACSMQDSSSKNNATAEEASRDQMEATLAAVPDSAQMTVANTTRRIQPEPFRITVFRQYPGAGCTSGYLAVNGNIICYTVEKPWRDNQQNVSSIPPGTYPASLRYDHTDHWRLELQNVPGRTNIQIHIGNKVDEIQGCILVGERLNADLCSLVGGTSAPAYRKLKKAFYGTETPTSTPNKSISVEIVGRQQ